VLLFSTACISCGHAGQGAAPASTASITSAPEVIETPSPSASGSPNLSAASTSTQTATSSAETASPGPESSGNAAGEAISGQIGEVLQVLASPSPGSRTSGVGAPTPQPEWTPSGPGVSTSIPLQIGLTIVTAGESPDGDLESIKRVTLLDSRGMTFSFDSKTRYSTIDAVRTTRSNDLDRSHSFFPDFCSGGPPKYYAKDETPVQGDHPGTTTLEISRGAFKALNSTGATSMTFFPSTFCMGMAEPAPVVKIGEGGVPIILDDRPIAVAAVHLHGGQPECLRTPAPIRFGCFDLWVLDDPDDPLVLRFVIDDEEMQVIKVSQGGPQIASTLASMLEVKKPADVYGIYFDFNQASIRPQSAPALAAIAKLLLQHPDWRLQINGHTDLIGSGAYNLVLSRRRAESVKAVLASKYHINPKRLATGGFGATQPKASNATLEGRALNRRVELIRS